MIIQECNIEGDLTLRVPLERRFPAGWDRLRWAWRALMGKSYERPIGVVITNCVIGKKLTEEWRLGGATSVPPGSANEDRIITGNVFGPRTATAAKEAIKLSKTLQKFDGVAARQGG